MEKNKYYGENVCVCGNGWNQISSISFGFFWCFQYYFVTSDYSSDVTCQGFFWQCLLLSFQMQTGSAGDTNDAQRLKELRQINVQACFWDTPRDKSSEITVLEVFPKLKHSQRHSRMKNGVFWTHVLLLLCLELLKWGKGNDCKDRSGKMKF